MAPQWCCSTIALLIAALAVWNCADARLLNRRAASGVAISAPNGHYCGSTLDRTMGIVFDFDNASMVANMTLVSFGQPFPACTAEPWTFVNNAVAFPEMSAPIHTTPDCMAVTLQHVWITDFVMVPIGDRHENLRMNVGAFSMDFQQC
jgi:hypothetical protein